MKIAVIGHIRHAIAEPFMGGMESHCHQLVTSLADRGHEVTLYSAAGSDLPQSEAICAQPYEDVLPWEDWRGTEKLAAYQNAAFERAWEAVLRGRYDVVHNNSLFPPLLDWASADGVPMVTSQHVPPFGAMRTAVCDNSHCDWQRITVTSHHQLTLWADCNLAHFAVVHNGIDTAQWPVAEERGEQLVWFGRITPNKGVREAVEAAHLAGVQLDIVGTIEDKSYFERAVAPFLGARIRYLGHKSGRALRECVASAAAAVVTPLWDEPFGLVAAEAMSCGVPVIAFDRGAMREVLGPCGLLVPGGDINALAQAMSRTSELCGKSCRARIEDRFSIERMLDGYEACYAAAIEGASSTLARSRSSSQSSTVAELA